MMSFERIERNRLKFDIELSNSAMRKYLSPATLGLYRELIPRLETYASGRVLDAGCGTMPFRALIQKYVKTYESLDRERRVPDVNYVADLQDMKPIASETYDVVLCTEVLEHTPDPARVVAEIWRVLKPHGKCILSVPCLSRLHEEPRDYFRFTNYGLRSVLMQNGFSIVDLVATGSLFSFLGHQVSTVLVGSLWHIPIVKHLAFYLNLILVTLPCYGLDRVTQLSVKFPLGFVVVAEKSDAVLTSSEK